MSMLSRHDRREYRLLEYETDQDKISNDFIALFFENQIKNDKNFVAKIKIFIPPWGDERGMDRTR